MEILGLDGNKVFTKKDDVVSVNGHELFKYNSNSIITIKDMFIIHGSFVLRKNGTVVSWWNGSGMYLCKREDKLYSCHPAHYDKRIGNISEDIIDTFIIDDGRYGYTQNYLITYINDKLTISPRNISSMGVYNRKLVILDDNGLHIDDKTYKDIAPGVIKISNNTITIKRKNIFTVYNIFDMSVKFIHNIIGCEFWDTKDDMLYVASNEQMTINGDLKDKGVYTV